MSDLLKHIYRFRSAEALLGEYQELQNQEIYFAPPEELNDPMEGFKDILWKGDAIVWTNLLRHYLLCLMRVVQKIIQQGPDCQFLANDIDILVTDRGLNPAERQKFLAICEKFFENDEVAQLPKRLGDRTSPTRRSELLSLLFFVHFRALRATFSALSPGTPLCAADKSLRGQQDPPFRFREYFAAMEALDKKYPNSADIAEQKSLQAASLRMQMILLLHSLRASEHPQTAWQAILSEFSDAYVNRLERLLYRDSYVACFVTEPTHAAMWGIYGNGHRGACLKFRAQPNTSGNPSLILRTLTGASGCKGRITPIYGEVAHELHEVRYNGRYVEIDFFRSMGALTGAQLGFWFTGPQKEVSLTGANIIGSETWRQEYWKNFYESLTTKLIDWQHEKERRAILHSELFDLSDKGSRKLRYRFEDLTGIIFGIKMPSHAKIEVRRIIEAKCKEAGRSDFEFHQAYYSRQKGRIEAAKLDLLNFNPSKGMPS